MGGTRIFLVMALLWLAPLSAFASPKEDANGVIDRWVEAYNANKPEAVIKLYAPDATFLGTSSPILSEGVESIKSAFERLSGSGLKVVIDERRMIVLGKDIVLGTGFYTFTRMQDNKPVPTRARFSMIIVKRGNDWLIVHHHSSAVPIIAPQQPSVFQSESPSSHSTPH